jgi:hypothetical protein
LGDQGEKTLVFARDTIEVSIQHPGAFYEQLPVLVRDYETMVVGNKLISLMNDGSRINIDLDNVEEAPHWQSHDYIAGKILCGIRIAGEDRLKYTLRFGSTQSNVKPE